MCIRDSNVSLSQPLFNWQNYVQYGQAKLQVIQAEANLAQAGQDLILRVAQAYFLSLIHILSYARNYHPASRSRSAARPKNRQKGASRSSR